MDRNIIDLFPYLTEGSFSITSPKDARYNCIAWASQDNEAWWWPDSFSLGYWPADIPREETLESFIRLFESAGYGVCNNAWLEDGFEKIALFIDSQGRPTHAARQLSSGNWTSKLGQLEDIEHNTLESLSGSSYGSVSVIMKRSFQGSNLK